jgi:hypothetical protein
LKEEKNKEIEAIAVLIYYNLMPFEFYYPFHFFCFYSLILLTSFNIIIGMATEASPNTYTSTQIQPKNNSNGILKFIN